MIQKSQTLTIAIFIIGISILNILVGAPWAFDINSETIEEITVESIIENRQNHQMLESTTPTIDIQARLAQYLNTDEHPNQNEPRLIIYKGGKSK